MSPASVPREPITLGRRTGYRCGDTRPGWTGRGRGVCTAVLSPEGTTTGGWQEGPTAPPGAGRLGPDLLATSTRPPTRGRFAWLVDADRAGGDPAAEQYPTTALPIQRVCGSAPPGVTGAPGVDGVPPLGVVGEGVAPPPGTVVVPRCRHWVEWSWLSRFHHLRHRAEWWLCPRQGRRTCSASEQRSSCSPTSTGSSNARPHLPTRIRERDRRPGRVHLNDDGTVALIRAPRLHTIGGDQLPFRWAVYVTLGASPAPIRPVLRPGQTCSFADPALYRHDGHAERKPGSAHEYYCCRHPPVHPPPPFL